MCVRICVCCVSDRKSARFPAECLLSHSVCACVRVCVVIIIHSAPSSEWPDSLRLKQEGSSIHSSPSPLTPAWFSPDRGLHRHNHHYYLSHISTSTRRSHSRNPWTGQNPFQFIRRTATWKTKMPLSCLSGRYRGTWRRKTWNRSLNSLGKSTNWQFSRTDTPACTKVTCRLSHGCQALILSSNSNI